MAELDKAVIAKIKKEGKQFEILIDPKKAHDYISGKNVDISEVLVLENIFNDAKKGIKASEHEMLKIFGTEDHNEIAKKILKEGHVPQTAEMIRTEIDQKRKQIIQIIQRNAIEPKSGKPHPATRIEAAINEAKVKIDENKPAEQQVQEVLSQIKAIIPIKMEIRELNIIIPSQHSGKAYGTLKQFGKVTGEKWENNGNLNATMEIPAGIQEELEIALNNLTKGTVEIKILRSK